MSSQNRIGLILVLVVIASVGVMLFARDTRASGEARLDNLSVACGPNQRATIHRLDDASQVNVACVDVGVETVVDVAPQPMAGGAPVVYYPATHSSASAAGYRPAPIAAVQPMAPVAAMPATSAAVVPVAASAPAPVVAAAPTPARRGSSNRPSTEKRLLVIGGTAGAGAGVGALIGGRKGALIGAAVGAGGATLVDQIKNR